MTEWPVSNLGDLCTFITDGSHNPPKGVEKSEFYMLSSRDIQNGKLTFEKPRYLNAQDFAVENKRTDIKLGDVLLTTVGTIGRTAIYNGTPEHVTFQRSVSVLRPNQQKITSKFLMYYLDSITEYLNREARGVAQQGIYLNQVRKLSVPIPSIEEQHKIVELIEDLLSRLDAGLADVKQARIKAAQFRSSILQSAFKRGAAEHNKSAWTTAQLSELVDIGWGDLQVTKKSYVQTGYLAYSATGPDGFLPYFDYDSEGIIISAIGANCGKIFRAKGKWSCIKNTMRILPKSPSVLLDYLFHYLSDSSIFPKRGSGQPFIGQQDAREIEISFPSIAEQKKIIEFVEYSISRLEASMKLAEEMEIQSIGLRRSLLQAAFTGQLTKEVVSV
jgi:restriction endonuclease S subunit